MPLLGRHKSTPTAVNQRNIQEQQQQVCESPLFGTRRQLPSSTTTTIAASKQTSSKAGNASSSSSSTAGTLSRSSNVQQKQQQNNNNNNSSSITVNEAGELLSSIPKQITRQQIHYAFSIIDINKDGMIDLRDFSQMLANLGVPIDEAILSHVMSTVSKRADRKISESEFLDWIGNFIQINDDTKQSSSSSGSGKLDGSSKWSDPTRGGARIMSKKGTLDGNNNVRSGKTKVSRSSTTGGVAASSLGSASSSSQLVAEPTDVPKTRRGSGSGLALMRSLSASAGVTSSSSNSNTNTNTNDSNSNSFTSMKRSGSPTGADGARNSSMMTTTKNKPTSNSKELQKQISSDSEDVRNDLKAAFLVFDVDGDGFITLDEVRAGLQLLGESWSPAELKQVFSKCGSSSTDLNKQQRINVDDFVKLLL